MHCIQVRTRRVPYFCRPEGDLRKSPAKRLDATQHVCALSAVGAGALGEDTRKDIGCHMSSLTKKA